LDKSCRDSISTFSFLGEADIQSGCTKILDDITSGEVIKIVRQSEIEIATRVGGFMYCLWTKTGSITDIYFVAGKEVTLA
jgi:hypothetical protein